jgi:hypothetical protein
MLIKEFFLSQKITETRFVTLKVLVILKTCVEILLIALEFPALRK